MTGSLAVVMASLAGVPSMAQSERRGVVRKSPYGVAETVRRIEQAARQHGLPVLASVDRTTRLKAQWVVVLTSSEGGTPVVMDPAAPAPAVPLAVHIEEGPDGYTVVRLPRIDDVSTDREQSDWPDSVVDELAGLPMIVDMALN